GHAHVVDVLRVDERLEVDHLAVGFTREEAVAIEHVGDAAAHPRSEVAAGAAEHDHAPAGHVFATVIAHTFHHDVRAAVADAEPLARHAADIGLAAGRAVQRDVADDDVLLGLEGGSLRRIRDHL